MLHHSNLLSHAVIVLDVVQEWSLTNQSVFRPVMGSSDASRDSSFPVLVITLTIMSIKWSGIYCKIMTFIITLLTVDVSWCRRACVCVEGEQLLASQTTVSKYCPKHCSREDHLTFVCSVDWGGTLIYLVVFLTGHVQFGEPGQSLPCSTGELLPQQCVVVVVLFPGSHNCLQVKSSSVWGEESHKKSNQKKTELLKV